MKGLKAALRRRTLGVLVNGKVDTSHQCALAAQKAGLHQEKCGQQVEGGDSSPLLHLERPHLES